MESEAPVVKYTIRTFNGVSNSSRGHTGPGIAEYEVDEEGTKETFCGEYYNGVRHGQGKCWVTLEMDCLVHHVVHDLCCGLA